MFLFNPAPKRRPDPTTAHVRIGVDLGQRMDYTAFAVVEAQWRNFVYDSDGDAKSAETHYVVRRLDRLPLGTSYVEVVQRIAGVWDQLYKQGYNPDVWLDATGVGQPVVDLIRNEGLPHKAVYINGSDRFVKESGTVLRLGKGPLVARLQILLQQSLIHLPNTAEAQLLTQELANYEIRVNENANAEFGAFRVGVHDDLTTALALAVYEDQYF